MVGQGSWNGRVTTWEQRECEERETTGGSLQITGYVTEICTLAEERHLAGSGGVALTVKAGDEKMERERSVRMEYGPPTLDPHRCAPRECLAASKTTTVPPAPLLLCFGSKRPHC